MTSISWTNTSGGTWTTGSNWSGGNVPGAGDTVTIAAGGAGEYAVVINSDVTVQAVTLDQPLATLQVGTGLQSELATNLALQAGTLALEDGTFTGTVTQTGGSFALESSGNFASGLGTLQSVTWQGVLNPINVGGINSGSLTIQNGLTLTAASGTGPGKLVLNQPIAAYFVGQQTLDNAAVSLGGTVNGITSAPALNVGTTGQAATLTLGAHLNLVATQNGQVGVNGLLTNDGVISTSGSTFLVFTTVNDSGFGTGTLANAGQINVNSGGILAIGTQDFSNSGTVMVGAGGDLILNATGPLSLQNTGMIDDNGLLSLSGALTTAQLQALNVQFGAEGAVDVSNNSTLLNGGATLAIGTGTTLPRLIVTGDIGGGTIAESGGGLTLSGGTLSGVTFSTPLSLTSSGTGTISGDVSFSGAPDISLTGSQTNLQFAGNRLLNGVTITMGSLGGDEIDASNFLQSATNGTLVLGAATHIVLNAGLSTIGGTSYNSAGPIINDGSITGSLGGTLVLNSSFVNDGTIALSGNSLLYLSGANISSSGSIVLTNSTLEVGDITAAKLKSIKLANSGVALAGTLTASGSTITVGAGSAISQLRLGVSVPGSGTIPGAAIVGGTIRDAGHDVLVAGHVSMTNVIYDGVLTVGLPNANLTATDLQVKDSTGKQHGTLVLSGNNANLDIGNGTVLDNMTVVMDNASGVSIGANTDSAFLGAGLVVTESGAYTGSIEGNTIVSYAQVNVTSGGTFSFSAGNFTNDGTITGSLASVTVGASVNNGVIQQTGGSLELNGNPLVNYGAISSVGSTRIDAASMVNYGTMTLGGAVSFTLYNYYNALPPDGTSFDNAGTLILSSATLTEAFSAGEPAVPLLNQTGALLEGTGTIAAELANYGTVTAVAGALTLQQEVSGVGQLDISAGSTLSLLSRVTAGQIAQFGGAGDVLGLSPKLFVGAIGGFASGDTIDLLKTAATSAAFSGDTIVVKLSTGGSLTLRTTSALSGSLTITSDGHGGSLIGFAGAAHNAAVVPDIANAPDLTPLFQGGHYIPGMDGIDAIWPGHVAM